MIRLLIADDHAVVRDGLRSLLEARGEMEVVAVEADGAAALASILRHQPDVAVLDVEMPELTGIEVTRKLQEARSRTAVVLLSMHKRAPFVKAAMASGACGYLLKEDASALLFDAVKSAAKGRVYISPSLGGSMVELLRSGAGLEGKLEITPRERDVVRLIAEGLTSKEIGVRLNLSHKHVHNVRADLMEKLKIHSIAGLVKYALRNHLTCVD